jgi:DNA-directed RNA polymerase sigma subunit (sigma70/sigma32)
MIVTQIFALLEEDSTMIISSDMLKEYYFEGKTYKEIGQKYGYTKQRIQQKIVDTIEYIKSHEKFKEIKSLTYYNE